jgi:hypothetical protein
VRIKANTATTIKRNKPGSATARRADLLWRARRSEGIQEAESRERQERHHKPHAEMDALVLLADGRRDDVVGRHGKDVPVVNRPHEERNEKDEQGQLHPSRLVRHAFRPPSRPAPVAGAGRTCGLIGTTRQRPWCHGAIMEGYGEAASKPRGLVARWWIDAREKT